MDWQIIAPQVVALVLGILGIWQGLRKQAGDGRSADAQTAAYLRDDLREQLMAVQTRLDLLEDYISTLETHVEELTAEMIAAGLRPRPRPRRRPVKD